MNIMEVLWQGFENLSEALTKVNNTDGISILYSYLNGIVRIAAVVDS